MSVSKRETGMYFVEGLSAKSHNRITTKSYKTIDEAIRRAIDMQNKRQIVQADILYTKNILTDIIVWGLDTKGIVKRYNRDTKQFEQYNMR